MNVSSPDAALRVKVQISRVIVNREVTAETCVGSVNMQDYDLCNGPPVPVWCY